MRARPRLWKCEKCASLGITKLVDHTLLRVRKLLLIVSSPKRKLIVFDFGETKPIACFVHAATAPRCAEQEVDPRFNRLAALELVNQKVANHLGMEHGALEAIPHTER
jgi:hypothetical protein